MKKSLQLIFAFTLIICSSCSTISHVFKNAKDGETYWDKTRDLKLNLSEFEGYYRVIYRDEEKNEMISENENITETNYISDLQYILINKKANLFIQISYIPIEKYHSRFLDARKESYSDTIDLYKLNLLNFGNLVNNFMILNYPNSKYNRQIKYYISESDSALHFDSIFYPGISKVKERYLALNKVFEDSYLVYHKMNRINLKNDTVPLKNTILFSTYKNRCQSKGKGRKNIIIFEYLKPNGKFPFFYFKQKGERLNFLRPVVPN
jgi:hypothetical protein